MRYLPKTEYTPEDQRRDTSFLVGSRFGKQTERARMLGILHRFGIEVPEAAMQMINSVYPRTWAPATEGTTRMANERAERWKKACEEARAELAKLKESLA